MRGRHRRWWQGWESNPRISDLWGRREAASLPCCVTFPRVPPAAERFCCTPLPSGVRGTIRRLACHARAHVALLPPLAKDRPAPAPPQKPAQWLARPPAPWCHFRLSPRPMQPWGTKHTYSREPVIRDVPPPVERQVFEAVKLAGADETPHCLVDARLWHCFPLGRSGRSIHHQWYSMARHRAYCKRNLLQFAICITRGVRRSGLGGPKCRRNLTRRGGHADAPAEARAPAWIELGCSTNSTASARPCQDSGEGGRWPPGQESNLRVSL